MLFKITKGLVGIDCENYLTPANDSRGRGSISHKYYRKYARLNVHKAPFFVCTVAEWNKLVEAAVSLQFVEIFKQHL